MSASSPQGQCCVCCAATTMRCGPCAKAGFDLFFCSQAHQKLIWTAHKLMCGMGSEEKPFRLSPLTKDELRLLKDEMEKPMGWTRIEEAFAQSFPAEEKARARVIFEALTQPDSSHNLFIHSFTAGLCFFRQYAFELHLDEHWPAGVPEHPLVPVKVPASALNVQASFASMFAYLSEAVSPPSFPDYVQSYPLHDPLYVYFLHRVVLKAGLAHLRDTRKSFTAEEVVGLDTLEHATGEMMRALGGMERKYPAQVSYVKDQLEQVKHEMRGGKKGGGRG
ncbi:hypothetical protein JCM8097_005240 [Rhodosporidiobolus ruineniae]